MAIYERFKTEADDQQNPDVVAGIRDILSSGMWSGGSGTLNSFFTSSESSKNIGFLSQLTFTFKLSDALINLFFN